MPAIKYINRLKRIDRLIKLQITGSPKELADKLEISERQVYRCLDNLIELGAIIEFNKLQNSCVYTSDKEILITFFSHN